MAYKCVLCGKSIEEIWPGKLRGTIVKINRKGKNILAYVCSECQREHREKLKEEVEKKVR